MSKTKILIFDFDATIYQGEHIFGEKWTQACVGVINYYFSHLTESEKRELYAKYDIPFNFDTSILKEKPAKYCLEILVGEGFTAADWTNYWHMYPFSEDWSLVTNIISNDMLKELSEKYKLYIVTNSYLSFLENYCKELNIDTSVFSGIYSNSTTRLGDNTRKDYYYNIILKKENVLPEQCIVIGDNYEADLVPAIELGMHTLFVDNMSWDYNNINKKLQELNPNN